MVWDPTGTCRIPGWAICRQPGELREILARAGPQLPLRAIYQPQEGGRVAHFEAVAWMCIRRKNLILAVDEVDELCNVHTWKIDKEYWRTHHGAVPALQHIVEWGRHVPMGMVCTSRNPSAVRRAITRNAYEIDVFQDGEPADLEYFRKRFGAETEQTIRTLPQYHYAEYIEGRPLQIRKSVKA